MKTLNKFMAAALLASTITGGAYYSTASAAAPGNDPTKVPLTESIGSMSASPNPVDLVIPRAYKISLDKAELFVADAVNLSKTLEGGHVELIQSNDKSGKYATYIYASTPASAQGGFQLLQQRFTGMVDDDGDPGTPEVPAYEDLYVPLAVSWNDSATAEGATAMTYGRWANFNNASFGFAEGAEANAYLGFKIDGADIIGAQFGTYKANINVVVGPSIET